MSKTNLVTIKINGVEINCTQEQAIAITMACGNNTTSATTTKSPKKSTTSKKTGGKEFDRAVYEKTAKKLKVWNKDKGKVNKDDREKVYAEMRKMGYAV